MATLQDGQPVTLFTNQMRTPVWVNTLNHACLELLHLSYCGVLHVGGAQRLSRAEFGTGLLDWWGFSQRASLTLAPAPAGAPWPPDTTLDSSRAQALLKTPILGVDEVLIQAGKER